MKNFAIYAAGLFDGEGCVEVYEGPQTRGRGIRLNMTLSIGMTDVRPLREMQAHFGGALTTKKPRPDKPRWAQAWRWSVSGEEAERFAMLVLPYSITKKEQLELYMELRDTCQRGSVRVATPPKVAKRRTQLIADIKSAKRLPG